MLLFGLRAEEVCDDDLDEERAAIGIKGYSIRGDWPSDSGLFRQVQNICTQPHSCVSYSRPRAVSPLRWDRGLLLRTCIIDRKPLVSQVHELIANKVRVLQKKQHRYSRAILPGPKASFSTFVTAFDKMKIPFLIHHI